MKNLSRLRKNAISTHYRQIIDMIKENEMLTLFSFSSYINTLNLLGSLSNLRGNIRLNELDILWEELTNKLYR